METILKDKIKNLADASTLIQKTDKNLAIASLIKLNSIPLYHSQAFLVPTYSKVSMSNEKLPYSPKHHKNESALKRTQHLKEIREIQEPMMKMNLNTVVKVKTDVNLNQFVSQKSNYCFDKPVKKIQNEKGTLKSAMKPKKLVTPLEKNKPVVLLKPVLEPFTYKKKIEMGSTSDTNSEMSKIKTETLSVRGCKFKPSPYASQLAKQYTENIKREQTEDVIDIWTKLEINLTARDEQIRLKEKTQKSKCDNSTNKLKKRKSKNLICIN